MPSQMGSPAGVHKSQTRRTFDKVPMIDIPVIKQPFERIAMDVIGPLEKPKAGHRFNLVIVDNSTRYHKAIPFRTVTARNIADELVKAFFDDICIFYMSLGEHPDHPCAVLERLRKHGTTVGPGKAKVPGEVVQYLGHIVGSGRLEPLFTKVEAVKSSRKPKMKSQLRLFFGLTDYYQKFSKNYASLAQPLSDLTRKDIPDRIPWQSHDQQAFNELKMVLFSQLILHSLDNSRLFKLQTDASDFVLSQGAVLSKDLANGEHPVFTEVATKERNFSKMEKVGSRKT
ncbi:hypothetical protein QYM36_013875 [Artemia franciscana]|uniref:RNA-directed DNA polymerase n=1 Tax=Artemia franciscana TaxID=6661 RepID=A0AA88L245_ARTSF|nr:hypothetical protein QYM36_013875 [Artemia franciscana]